MVTVVIVAIGLHAHVHEGMTAVNAVAFGLALVWAVTGVVAARFSDRVWHGSTCTPRSLRWTHCWPPSP